MDLDDIHSQMLQILEDKKSLNGMNLEKKWASFMKEYPLIFISLEKEDVDLNMLKTMIGKLKKVKSGEKTHENAEKEFGNVMAEKYIYTKFEKPTQGELDTAYTKAVKNQEKQGSSF